MNQNSFLRFLVNLAFVGSVAFCHGETPLILKRAAQPPVIDGLLEESCWQNTTKLPLRHYAGGELKVSGSVALCYDDQNLYVALWLDEPTPEKMAAPKAEVNGPDLWKGEVIEWFICPSEEGNEYVQLAWNPAATRFNARCVSTGAGTFKADTAWRPKWNCASVIGKNGWTTEASISFAELGIKKPAEGACWRLNVNRTRQIGDREWSALAPTGAGGFHIIDRFAEVFFGKPVASAPVESVKREGPVRALIGCWGHSFGLAAIFEPHVQLDRALGKENVEIRETFNDSMLNWPRQYRDLARNDLVVLTDVPATHFADKQLQDLRRYVLEGGSLILMGPMTGWKHTPEDAWFKSALGEYLPTKPDGTDMVRPLDPTAENHALFNGIPLETVKLTARTREVKLTEGATLIASAGGLPFIAERKAGQGRVIQIQGEYAHKATMLPVSCFRTDFFMSAYYPVFWDNLVQYAVGRPGSHAAPVPALPPKKDTALIVDIIGDNLGDIFRPGAMLRLKPLIEGRTEYAYDLWAFIEGPNVSALTAGHFVLAKADDEFQIPLPHLDRGRYTLRLELRKSGTVVDTATAPFSVALPLLAEDEFNFKALVDCAYQGETDAKRIAAELKSIGFDGIFWLGGDIYAGYQGVYRLWNEGRAESRFQEAGLRVTPVFYPNLYGIVNPGYTGVQPGQVNPFTKLAHPDMGYPGKSYLPHARFWLEIFDKKIQGRKPLTDGYAAADEIIGGSYPVSDRVRKSFETATGRKAPAKGQDDGAYPFLNYRLKLASDFVWFARAVSNAYNPAWSMESVMTPNSFCGHSSCLADVPGTLSSLGATSPDEYWYGESKLYLKSLCSMAIAWSGTDFGRLARPDFMGGQLGKSYYEEFPEQVFAALTAGARRFSVFAYECASFEKNGRQDPKFAEIARKTTADAARIGRTLNHYDRARARVALLYPHTAHLWLSMGKDFNADYLKMTGTSDQYLPLTYAVQAEFDLLRRTFGHVDFLFDEQIRRGDLRNYDILVLAYARQVEERTLREIRRFVESGGTLFVTTDSGRLNENNQPTETLYGALPAGVSAERAVSTDYSDTRMSKPEIFSRGNALSAKEGSEILFTFPDNQPACVRGAVGRGDVIVLGMPLAGLKTENAHPKLKLLSYVLEKKTRLISKPDDGDFSAITFLPKRGEGRIFMVFNGNKAAAKTRVYACGDEAEAKDTLADIVTGEKAPFEVKDGKLTFEVSCPDRWGRAFALMPKAPARIEVSVTGPMEAGRKFMLAVRLLGADDQPVRSTLPFELAVKDPDGLMRDDISGVRVAEQGVYVFAMDWPVGAKCGKWGVTVKDKISSASDSASWEAR
ncbi:MAG: beta-galactosidase trimerization domain-containing protein [Verrucomicrobia bacterium]|nr:beta-galactosidase trimerization domain-containing protein [Verrucomicrobiota bacterium]